MKSTNPDTPASIDHGVEKTDTVFEDPQAKKICRLTSCVGSSYCVWVGVIMADVSMLSLVEC